MLLFIGPQTHPADLVTSYHRQLAPGSLLATSHLCDERAPAGLRAQVAAAVDAYKNANEQLHIRTREKISSWFNGMELIEPGVVLLPDWRPETPAGADDLVFCA